MSLFSNDWAIYLNQEFNKPYFDHLRQFLKKEYEQATIYPCINDIFNALHMTPHDKTKVVIIGQDPYHGPNQAHGLSFSVQQGIKPPPSLLNIFKEMQTDLGHALPDQGCLTKWADEGVLLLNTVLTVRKGEPYSHKGKGWETFTDRVIQTLNKRDLPLVFILWGKHAQAKKHLITRGHHAIIESAHPSPLSSHRGFFGSRPFSRVNHFLHQQDITPINWQL